MHQLRAERRLRTLVMQRLEILERRMNTMSDTYLVNMKNTNLSLEKVDRELGEVLSVMGNARSTTGTQVQ